MSANEPSPTVPGRIRLLDVALIGMPDALAALWCLWVWRDPLAFGVDAVKCVVLMMLMEFILLNATGFFTAISFVVHFGRRTRSGMLLGLCVLYLLLVAAFATPFHAVWPWLTFGWLALAKLAWVVRNRRICASEQMWLMGMWAVSVVAYLGAVGIGASQNLPRFGITPAIVSSLHLPGGGAWVAAPHKAVASAVIYFAALAVFKWFNVAVRKHQPSRARSTNTDIASSAALDTLA